MHAFLIESYKIGYETTILIQKTECFPSYKVALMHWRRKWQPTPVFLPGESQGRRSLVGCRLRGRTESDKTEAT